MDASTGRRAVSAAVILAAGLISNAAKAADMPLKAPPAAPAIAKAMADWLDHALPGGPKKAKSALR